MVAELPSGSVTFLLTDIEGSTRLFRRLGDQYPPLLEQHNRVLRSALTDHGGVEFKSEGDALLVAFDSAAGAFEAAVDAQRRIRAEPWPPDAPIRVRMGLHTGIAYPHDGDYIALALHQAARVVGTGSGGQVVASADAVAAAGTVEGIEVRRLGAYRLRDFDGPAELHQLSAVGDRERISGPPSNTSRRPQRVAAARRLRRSFDGAHRARGFGGARPTGDARRPRRHGEDPTRGRVRARRRAVVERRRVDDRSGRLSAGDAVGPAVADVLGVAPGDEDPVDAVVEHLRARRALLVLDNCEHVLTSARELTRAVLAACDEVGVLATTRERLAVGGEYAVVVSSLPLEEASVDLFLDRAAATGGRPAARARRPRGHRRDLPAPRRHAARDRAGRGAGHRPDPSRDPRRPSGSTGLPATARRCRLGTAADPARPARLELRPARGGRADRAAAPVRLRRKLRCAHGRRRHRSRRHRGR